MVTTLNIKNLINYWYSAETATKDFNLAKRSDYILVSQSELINGHLSPENYSKLCNLRNQSLIPNRSSQESLCIIVAPIIAFKNSIFNKHVIDTKSLLVVLAAYAEVTNNGEILPTVWQSLPWIPSNLLEPTVQDCALGRLEKLNNFYSLQPPCWEATGIPENIAQQLQYGYQLLDFITDGNWQEYLAQDGYQTTEMAAIFIANVALQAPTEVFTDPYANAAVLAAFFDSEISWSLSKQEFKDHAAIPGYNCHITKQYALTKQQRQVLLASLAEDQEPLIFINASASTGKTTIFSDFIACKWTEALINNTPAPNIAIVAATTDPDTIRLASIVTTAQITNLWAGPLILQLATLTEKRKQNVVNNYLKHAAIEFGKNLKDLKSVKQLLLIRLKNLNNNLTIGIAAAQDYYDLSIQINNSYQQYGGIAIRYQELQESVNKQQAYVQYLQVLQGLWQRQIQPESGIINKLLSFIPACKTKKLAKLKLFLQKHLPQTNIVGDTILELQQFFNELQITNLQTQQELLEIYNKVASDLQHFNNARIKLQTLVPINIDQTFKLTTFNNFLDLHLRYRIYLTALHYWEAEFLELIDINAAQLAIYYQIYPINYNTQQPLLDYLLIENSEFLRPLAGWYCLQAAKKLIIMGDQDQLIAASLLPAIDSKLINLHFPDSLAAELENLELTGATFTAGSFSSICYSIVSQNSAMLSLSKQWQCNPSIIVYHNQLLNISSLSAGRKFKPSFIKAFHYLPVDGKLNGSGGSYYNAAEISAVIAWLIEYQAAILTKYPETPLNQIVSIVTPFYGQLIALKQALASAQLELNNVRLLQTPTYQSSAIVIFSAAYDHTTKGSMLLDQGSKIMRNLLLATHDHLVVIGSPKIFDPQLHSITGKFAKYLVRSLGCVLPTEEAVLTF